MKRGTFCLICTYAVPNACLHIRIEDTVSANSCLCNQIRHLTMLPLPLLEEREGCVTYIAIWFLSFCLPLSSSVTFFTWCLSLFFAFLSLQQQYWLEDWRGLKVKWWARDLLYWVNSGPLLLSAACPSLDYDHAHNLNLVCTYQAGGPFKFNFFSSSTIQVLNLGFISSHAMQPVEQHCWSQIGWDG